MRKFLLALSAASAALATPAFAQDAGAPPPDPATFTGPRVGALVGYDKLKPGNDDNGTFRDHSADGVQYGADVGYDAAIGGAVVGIEGEVSGSTAKVTNEPQTTGNFGYGRVKAGRDLYLGARAGIRAAPNTLVYAKGGYTNARLDLTASDGTTETGRHFNLDGYRVGAGVEQAIGHKAYAKIEYRYSNYSDARLEYLNGSNSTNFDVNTDRHQVVVGAGVRF